MKWSIDCSFAKGHGAEVFGAPVTISSTQAADAQYTHQATEELAAAVTVEPTTIIIVRLYRDPNDAADTFEDDAFLIQLNMLYRIGQPGTAVPDGDFSANGF